MLEELQGRENVAAAERYSGWPWGVRDDSLEGQTEIIQMQLGRQKRKLGQDRERQTKPGMIAHTCKPGCLGSGGRRIRTRPVWATR